MDETNLKNGRIAKQITDNDIKTRTAMQSETLVVYILETLLI